MEAVNGLLLDILAATARKDYDDRRRRQAQGVAKARAEGKFQGRPENVDRNAGIAGMLTSGMSWSDIEAATGCGRATIAKVRSCSRECAIELYRLIANHMVKYYKAATRVKRQTRETGRDEPVAVALPPVLPARCRCSDGV